MSGDSGGKRWWEGSSSGGFDFLDRERRIQRAADLLQIGQIVEVEGQAEETVAGRRFSTRGGDWQTGKLLSVQTLKAQAEIEHIDVFKDEAGTEPLKETVGLWTIRPTQPEEVYVPKAEDEADVRLADEDGESTIWWSVTVLEVEEGGKRCKVRRTESGEETHVAVEKCRPSKLWAGEEGWLGPNDAEKGAYLTDGERQKHLSIGEQVEVSGDPCDSPADRQFLATGADWQQAVLLEIKVRP
jgi:hypothetical protein